MIDNVGFLGEIPYIKSRVLELFLSDGYLMKLVADRADIVVPALDLRYTQVYPFEYTMGTTTSAKAFITMETSVTSRKDLSNRQHPGIVDVSLYIYAFCHESIMIVDDTVARRLGLEDENARGSRVDLMCSRIDELINGSELSSFGKFVFDDQQILNPVAVNYHGKCNCYMSMNANRYGGAL